MKKVSLLLVLLTACFVTFTPTFLSTATAASSCKQPALKMQPMTAQSTCIVTTLAQPPLLTTTQQLTTATAPTVSACITDTSPQSLVTTTATQATEKTGGTITKAKDTQQIKTPDDTTLRTAPQIPLTDPACCFQETLTTTAPTSQQKQ